MPISSGGSTDDSSEECPRRENIALPSTSFIDDGNSSSGIPCKRAKKSEGFEGPSDDSDEEEYSCKKYEEVPIVNIPAVDDDDEEDDIDAANESTDSSSSENIPLSKYEKKHRGTKNKKKCSFCKQFLNSRTLIQYRGHPRNAVNEEEAVTNDDVFLYPVSNRKIKGKPIASITNFTVYDQEGHLCPIDSGLIENEAKIYLSGYCKSITSDSDPANDEAIPVKNIGPITEWHIQGLDSLNGEFERVIIVSTESGEYHLKNVPSDYYKPMMVNLYQKLMMTKVVVEFLIEDFHRGRTYKDLVNSFWNLTVPETGEPLTEEMLCRHAQFIYNQVVGIEAKFDVPSFTSRRCMTEFIERMNVRIDQRIKRKRRKMRCMRKKRKWSKATTTYLVRRTFRKIFVDQLDTVNVENIPPRKRCGVCVVCQRPPCRKCSTCKRRIGTLNCKRRRCPYSLAREDVDNVSDQEDYSIFRPVMADNDYWRIKWIGEPVQVDNLHVYYDKVEIFGSDYCVGDFINMKSKSPNIPLLIARIVYMWNEISPQTGEKKPLFHAELFMRAEETVLGPVGDPREVFPGDNCCHGICLTTVVGKAYVEKKNLNDWFQMGGKKVEKKFRIDDGNTYFYSKYYDTVTGRFEDLPETPTCQNPLRQHRFCPSCERRSEKDIKSIPIVSDPMERSVSLESYKSQWASVKWKDHNYTIGSGVFLKRKTFQLPNSLIGPIDRKKSIKRKPKTRKPNSTIRFSGKTKKKTVKTGHENVYSENYRKKNLNLRGSNDDTGRPFDVGCIAAIIGKRGPLIDPSDITLKVHVMYRPENISKKNPEREDVNLVYWSENIVEIPFSAVVGPCMLAYDNNSNYHRQDWLEKDPRRFYFKSAYDHTTDRVMVVPEHAKAIGRTERVKQKEHDSLEVERIRPLRTMDVFAGCGGLSTGLARAGAADCRWAIEIDDHAAQAFSLNHRGCTVYNVDCNSLLREIMSGAKTSATGLRLPARGEVELLIGGPPCQGFSSMNRFSERDYSIFKNSLVVSFLSYCDYYRPKYFILENVRNFVAYKKGLVLKLTLRALLDMGYQCTFGVLQAGHYGVPQTRRRFILMAAAPGLTLPSFPEPAYVFNQRACALYVFVDGKRYITSRWRPRRGAPRRTCTVRDAMGDLPRIKSGECRHEIEYGSRPATHFQRSARARNQKNTVTDHVCKEMAPIVEERIKRIPTEPGADWRDLPNIVVRLSDGTKCKELEYRYDNQVAGRASDGSLRGVCACAEGRKCSPEDKQKNTLIPWCLPHTADRNNQFAGLYGRLSWSGFFSTTVTDPEPMGMQGQVLHPDQHRVVSVRECARSQGFDDDFLFAGTVLDKHRQIGNAVPPPLAKALGRELIQAKIKDLMNIMEEESESDEEDSESDEEDSESDEEDSD